jgi:hypothetical protein
VSVPTTLALPNGIATIVSSLAASVAGTAAPLNPGYTEEEFRFYLDDTNAKALLLPPEGIDEARRAAGSVPILTDDTSDAGVVSLREVTGRAPRVPRGEGAQPHRPCAEPATAHRRGVPVPPHAPIATRDLGQAARQRRLQPAVVGAVVELGDRMGLPMTAARAVYACAKLLDERSRAQAR